jgi:hypothetical protein
MNFKQLDTEHVAQAWERMKSLIKNCPTHGQTTWMIIQTFYAGLIFFFAKLIGFSCWRYLYVHHSISGGSGCAYVDNERSRQHMI